MDCSSLSPFQSELPEAIRLGIAPVCNNLAQIHPQEQSLVRHAITSRRNEFSSARLLAQELLASLGQPRRPLLAKSDRSPDWPENILGSISHSRKWCAVAIAKAEQSVLGLGLDIEDYRGLKPDLFPEILSPEELKELQHLKSHEEKVLRVLSAFSLKEAIYKSLYPFDNTGLGFQDIRLSFQSSRHPLLVQTCNLSQRLPKHCRLQLFSWPQDDYLLSVAVLLHGPPT